MTTLADTFATRIQKMALLAAIILYGLYSQPTPDAPGIAEIIIGALLFVAIGLTRIMQLTSVAVLWTGPKAQTVPVYYLIFMPLVIGIGRGLPWLAVLRDVVPLLYFLLPVILRTPANNARVAWALCGAGLCFAMRYAIITGADLQHLSLLKNGDNLMYLPLEPAVLFAALYLAMWGFARLTIIKFKLSTLYPWLALAAAALCIATIAGLVMRAALLLAVMSLTVFALWQLQRGRRHWLSLLIIGALLLLFAPQWLAMLETLWRKTQAVGFNARDAEFSVVWHGIADSPLTLLYGHGWGATIADPAVGGWRVGYTHSFISYLLEKTGLVGTGLMLCYLGSLLPALRVTWHRDRLLWLAAVPPLLLAITLYTSYKYFTCGLLLWLVTRAAPGSDDHAYPAA